MISASEAIRVGRSLLKTPYGSGSGQLDCINFIKKIIRTAPGGVPGYTTAGTNSLWDSFNMASKYRDLTWRQEGIFGAKAGMLAFKRDGSDVHHVGLVTGEGTVIHASSGKGCVVETDLQNGQWHLLGIHRYIGVTLGSSGTTSNTGKEGDTVNQALYMATVTTEKDPLRVRKAPETGEIIGHVPRGKTVEVLQNGSWPFIRYGELEGFASAQFLTRIASESPAPNVSSGPVGGVQIEDDAGNSFRPTGNFRVIVGDESID